MNWFGQSWGAAVYDHVKHVATPVGQVEAIAGRVGISPAELHDIGRRGVEHVESLKRRRAAHNIPDDRGKRTTK